VFFQGSDLTGAWAGQPQWRVLATGFGAGLDFLATWQAWRSDPQRPRLLHYLAVDAHPAPPGSVAMDRALQPLAEALAAQWQGLLPGFHRFSFEDGRVLLTLCLGDVPAMLREQSLRADTVLLAGVEPALETVRAVTRLCRRGAQLATATASAQVQRDLRACGWQVQAVDAGLALRAPAGLAAEGLVGHYEPAWQVKGLDDEAATQARDCIVIGAGLAGAAVAASLARRGWSVRVLDAATQPAAGASGLPAGLLAPHQSPDDNLLSRLSRAGVRITLQEASRLAAGIEWERTGALEWRGDDRRPLPALGEELAVWSRAASEAQKRAAGLDPAQPAWWHENAAWIEPAALVRLWLRQPGVRFSGGHSVARVRRGEGAWIVEDATGAAIATAPLVVVAAALGSAALLHEHGIQVRPVRGQLTWAPRVEADAHALPPFPVHGHGHFLPRVPLVERAAWITGSTYGRGDADAGLRGEDQKANLERVRKVMPRAARAMGAAAARGETRSWAGVRCASSDRRPLAGEVAPGLWLSTAMGSRGLTFAALGGELIAARLHREPLPIEARLAQALEVSRQLPPRRG
jgi:tRNA 5-methylaminomethyl-2-thiouridine biosynthesis bifunctional protein